MDQPKGRIVGCLTILAMIAGIVACIFAAPQAIVALRQLRSELFIGNRVSTPTQFAATVPSSTASPKPILQVSVTPSTEVLQPTSTRPSMPTLTVAPSPTKTPLPTATKVSIPTTATAIWRQGDIRAEAGFSSVWDTSFRLWFKITNEGTNDFVARFRMEDFSIIDDTGQTYPLDESAGPKTAQIRPNRYTTYYLDFKGALNPNAKNLILRLAQLSGTSDISITIPLGSDVSSIRTEAGFSTVWDTSFRLWFKITNEGTNDFVARFRMEDFSIIDDTGQTYPLDESAGPKTAQIRPNRYTTYYLDFKGALNPNAKNLILRLAQLSGRPDISVQIPINQ